MLPRRDHLGAVEPRRSVDAAVADEHDVVASGEAACVREVHVRDAGAALEPEDRRTPGWDVRARMRVTGSAIRRECGSCRFSRTTSVPQSAGSFPYVQCFEGQLTRVRARRHRDARRNRRRSGGRRGRARRVRSARDAAVAAARNDVIEAPRGVSFELGSGG